MSVKHRNVAWLKEGWYGAEFAEVTLGARWLSATGDAIGFDPEPYRLHYLLETGRGYVTSRLEVSVRAPGWSRDLTLERSESGVWTGRFGDASRDSTPSDPPTGVWQDSDLLAEALDCDLGLSPLTNSMPVLRHDLLHGGEPREFVMAWVSVPDLSIHAVRQRYTFLRREGDGAVIRYENADGSFTSDLVFDGD